MSRDNAVMSPLLLAAYCRDNYRMASAREANAYQMYMYRRSKNPQDPELEDLKNEFDTERFLADIWAVTFMNLTGLQRVMY
jgi:hypothetical protein